MAKKKSQRVESPNPPADYDGLLGEVVSLLEAARRSSARAVNAVMTTAYWEIGRRIVVIEQRGKDRADYGARLVAQLSQDLSERFGRGFSRRNIEQMRLFYLHWPIAQTPSAQLDATGRGSVFRQAAPQVQRFPLPWSHYVELLAVKGEDARRFYETEALRNGWSVRQLSRQIGSQFYERVVLSKNKSAMLRREAEPQPNDLVRPEEEIKDPFVLEFLDLKDEYSEHDLEEALIHKLEDFLLELGGDFTFVGRQKRLRVGDEWYRIDLLFFHRRLRCLVVIDLKIGKFTHADAGQMHLYLNYAQEHWTHANENPPVGLILCAQKDDAVAHYSLEGLPNKVMASEYRLALPDEKLLVEHIEKTQRFLEARPTPQAPEATEPKRTARKPGDPAKPSQRVGRRTKRR